MSTQNTQKLFGVATTNDRQPSPHIVHDGNRHPARFANFLAARNKVSAAITGLTVNNRHCHPPLQWVKLEIFEWDDERRGASVETHDWKEQPEHLPSSKPRDFAAAMGCWHCPRCDHPNDNAHECCWVCGREKEES